MRSRSDIILLHVWSTDAAERSVHLRGIYTVLSSVVVQLPDHIQAQQQAHRLAQIQEKPTKVKMTELVSGEVYKFVNAQAGTVMDLSGEDNVSVIGYGWHDSDNQKVSSDQSLLLPVP